MDDYESWTRSEIEAARARVRDLESALEMFLAWRASNPNASKAASLRATPKINGTAALNGAHPSAKRLRTSKNEAIFEAFEAAGPNGLSQEDVQRIASEHGLITNPNALRALCWSAKKDGRLVSLAPGRYAIAPKNETAPGLPDNNGDRDAVSTRTDHDRHREGDARGGTS